MDAKVLGAVNTQMASEDLRSQEEMPRDWDLGCRGSADWGGDRGPARETC